MIVLYEVEPGLGWLVSEADSAPQSGVEVECGGALIALFNYLSLFNGANFSYSWLIYLQSGG
jgi:hypothetical protein